MVHMYILLGLWLFDPTLSISYDISNDIKNLVSYNIIHLLSLFTHTLYITIAITPEFTRYIIYVSGSSIIK